MFTMPNCMEPFQIERGMIAPTHCFVLARGLPREA
jgi:hypothetical protein